MGRDILASEMSPKKWFEIIQEVSPSDKEEHPVICYSLTEDGRDIHKYIVQTKQEYETNRTSCQLLGLQAIINYSRLILNDVESEISKVKFYKKISRIIEQDRQQVDSSTENEIIPSIRDHAKPFKVIPEILEKMCKRARQRRLVEVTQGIWATIKWYIEWCIWRLFYDQSNEVKDLKEKYAINPIIDKTQKLISGKQNWEAVSQAIAQADFLQ